MRPIIGLSLAAVLLLCCGCRIPTPLGTFSWWDDDEREHLLKERQAAQRGHQEYRELNSLGAGKTWGADPLLERGTQENNAHIAGIDERLSQLPR